MKLVDDKKLLQKEFRALVELAKEDDSEFLARKLLRLIPIVCNPNVSRNGGAIGVFEVLSILRDALNAAVSSAYTDFPKKDASTLLTIFGESPAKFQVMMDALHSASDLQTPTGLNLFKSTLFETNPPLDADRQLLGELENLVFSFRGMMDGFPAGDFWSDWYQGFLDGNPLDWELQRRVALIPDEDWEKGPEHIAKKIDEIRARFELEKRLEVLAAEKQVWEERARLGVGGNNPPEAIEDDRIVQEIIWAPIEELKAETQADSPNTSRINSAVSKLAAALIAIGKWPLRKLDKAADEFAKSLGKWAGGACAGWLVFNADKIAEIIQAAQNWLATLR